MDRSDLDKAIFYHKPVNLKEFNNLNNLKPISLRSSAGSDLYRTTITHTLSLTMDEDGEGDINNNLLIITSPTPSHPPTDATILIIKKDIIIVGNTTTRRAENKQSAEAIP